MTSPLPDFTPSEFTAGGSTRTVWRSGTGPGVVIMHEVPGITPSVAGFGRVVRDAGFTVVMPDLFGVVGKPFSPGYVASSLAKACIRKEFHAFSTRTSSPICNWLRALCRDLHQELGGPGVGALGMCFTGNFALALMVDAPVMAPVLSQPSLPLGLSRAARQGLHLSPQELVEVKRRVAEEKLTVLGLRFTHDLTCPKPRFDRLSQEIGDAFERIEIDSGPGNPHKIKRTAHSVLTNDLVDKEGHPTLQARNRVLAFFKERLVATVADPKLTMPRCHR